MSFLLSPLPHRKAIDRTGERHGRLLVTSRATFAGNQSRWHCHCDCGADCIVSWDRLRSDRAGVIPSCGCVQAEAREKRLETDRGITERCCIQCKQTKPISEYRLKQKGRGRVVRSAKCRLCLNARERNRRAELTKEAHCEECFGITDRRPRVGKCACGESYEEEPAFRVEMFIYRDRRHERVCL